MLRLYNTLTRTIEDFSPRTDKQIKMFSCGPSVYRRPHIGNYRTFLYEDVLQRYLEYLGFDVVRLITLTDIEDKAIIEAEKQQISVKELAEQNRHIYIEDSNLLRMRHPTYRACMMACTSTAIDETATLTKMLLEKDFAYYHKYHGRQNVYYDPLKSKDFGKLARLDMRKWPLKKRRFHRDTYEGNRWNRGDFILWHGYKEGDAEYWDTEIGRGRPSWNIQDAATIVKYIGVDIDVACGGIDNLFRHHDYTSAIIESISEEPFTPHWLHGQHLLVDGKKMSKSRGNVYYPLDLITKGYTGEQVRFFLIYGHYRKRLNFTLEKFGKTSRMLETLRTMVDHLGNARSTKSSQKATKIIDRLVSAFENHMNNDLDVKTAFNVLFADVCKLDALRKQGKVSADHGRTALFRLQQIDAVLQVIFSPPS